MKYVLILAAASIYLPAFAFDPGGTVAAQVISQNNNNLLIQQTQQAKLQQAQQEQAAAQAKIEAGQRLGASGLAMGAGAIGGMPNSSSGNVMINGRLCGPGSTPEVCNNAVGSTTAAANPMASVPAPKVVGPTSLDFDQNEHKTAGTTTSSGGTRIGNGFAIGHVDTEEIPDWMKKAAEPHKASGSTSMK